MDTSVNRIQTEGERNQHGLAFYKTPTHACGYLPERQAAMLFADPCAPKDARLYSLLSVNGFRRSGEYLYKPHCPHCRACLPTRVATAHVALNRRQRRIWRKNEDLTVLEREPRFVRAHFELYRTYINRRHPGGGMENPTTEQYKSFLTSSWSRTVFYEFRLDSRPVAIAVTDYLIDGLSAIYTFFDPDLGARSLGVYTILWQIREAFRLGRDWMYLGYQIDACAKMRYKREYQPQQQLVDGRWRTVGHPP